MKKYGLILVVILLLISSLPVHAQDEPLTADEIELVNFLAAAYDNLLALETYQGESKQTVLQDISTSALSLVQNVDQEVLAQIQINPDGGASNMYNKTAQNITSTVSGEETQLENIVEMIIFDGVFYMRYSQELPGIPTGWFLAQDLPGMEMIDMEEFAELTGSNALALYPINEETIRSITELETDTVDGIEMRVFDVEWDLPALVATDALGGLLDPTALGLTEDEYWQMFAENSTQTQRIWIGAEDSLIYRVDIDMESMLEFPNTPQGAMTIAQTTTGSTLYFGFNEPVKIEAPTLGE